MSFHNLSTFSSTGSRKVTGLSQNPHFPLSQNYHKWACPDKVDTNKGRIRYTERDRSKGHERQEEISNVYRSLQTRGTGAAEEQRQKSPAGRARVGDHGGDAAQMAEPVPGGQPRDRRSEP